MSLTSIFYLLFQSLNYDLSYTLIYAYCSFKQSLMTSQIWSHIGYLVLTEITLKLLLHSTLMKKSSLTDGFSKRFYDNSEVVKFLGHRVHTYAIYATPTDAGHCDRLTFAKQRKATSKGKCEMRSLTVVGHLVASIIVNPRRQRRRQPRGRAAKWRENSTHSPTPMERDSMPPPPPLVSASTAA